jgi:hypothetical protein
MVGTRQPVLLVGLRTDGLRRNDSMKTANRENPNSRTWLRNEPSKWGGKRETSLLIHRGWKARKVPAVGEVFFLTFPFRELTRTWESIPKFPSTETHRAEALFEGPPPQFLSEAVKNYGPCSPVQLRKAANWPPTQETVRE